MNKGISSLVTIFILLINIPVGSVDDLIRFIFRASDVAPTRPIPSPKHVPDPNISIKMPEMPNAPYVNPHRQNLRVLDVNLPINSQSDNIRFIDEYFYAGDDWALFHPDEVIETVTLNENMVPVPSSKGHKIISIIPTEERAFKNVFKQEFSVKATSDMKKAYKDFEMLDAYIASTDDFDNQALVTLIRENDDTDPLIIIGHSEAEESGRVLQLPSGETMLLSDIHKTCLHFNTNCLVLTCYSDDFNLNTTINLNDAYHMTKRGIDILELVQQNNWSLSLQVQIAMDKGLITTSELMVAGMRHERILRKATKVAMIGTATGAGGTYMITSRFNSD